MSGFACMECGYKFRTVKAAEKAAFGERGCPKCGGSDIDLAPGTKTVRKMVGTVPVVAVANTGTSTAVVVKCEGGA